MYILRVNLLRILFCLLAGGISAHYSYAFEAEVECQGTEYGRGKRAICLPLGALSFADKWVSFTPGEKPSLPPFDNGEAALGEPNYKNTRSPDFVSLGCNSELVLQFTDNVLIDVSGMDLYIFEVGPFVEKTELFISNDASTWIAIGEIEGVRSEIDIQPYVTPSDTFAYVKLVNAGKSCGQPTFIRDARGVGARPNQSFLALFDCC